MISATIIGRLGGPPETKTIGQTTVTNFSLATTKKDRDGKEQTTWTRCALWGKRGEAFARFHKKGDRAFVTGELYLREYESANGKGSSLELDVQSWAFAQSKDEGQSSATTYSATKHSTQDVPF